ncbi:MAG: hypothetical protein WC551_12015 [Patescibacteria group bacterium]
MTRTDVSYYLRQLLLSKTAITQTVSDRVWEAPLVNAAEWSSASGADPQLPCIVVAYDEAGGWPADEDFPLQERAFIIQAVAVKRDDAMSLFGKVQDALATSQQTISAKVISGIRQTVPEVIMQDPDALWHIAEGTFLMVMEA